MSERHEPPALQQQEVPSEPEPAKLYAQKHNMAVTRDWMVGWDACRKAWRYGKGDPRDEEEYLDRDGWRTREDAASPSTTRQQEAGSGWIPTSERIPAKDEEVLTYDSSADSVTINKWCDWWEAPVSFSSKTICVGEGWETGEYENVTHWMPLPAAPSTHANERTGGDGVVTGGEGQR